MKIYLFIATCFVSAFACGQDQQMYRHEFGTSPFILEANSETFTQQVEPKFLTGLYYKQQFGKRWYWNSQVEYGENSLNDYGSGADYISGKGQYSELNIFSGIRFILNANKSSTFSWYLGSDLYLSWLNYSGYFEGGWSGGIYLRNNSYYFAGGQFGGGLKIRLFSRIVLSGYSSIRVGYGFEKNNIIYGTSKSVSNAATLLKLSIGYLF